MAELTSHKPCRWLVIALAVVLALFGAVFVAGGGYLITLGGSWYYLITGIALLVSALLLFRGSASGLVLFLAIGVATAIWGVYEVGFAFWGLVPRLAPFVAIGIVAALLLPAVAGSRAKVPGFAIAAVLVAVFGYGLWGAFQPQGVLRPDAPVAVRAGAQPSETASNWQYYGYSGAGTRFAPYNQITADNVSNLEVAWTFRTGEEPVKGSEFQNTPTQIGDNIYVCTPLNKVISLDATTGQEKWRFDPKAKSNTFWNRCRGVGYYESAVVPEGQQCHARIILTTIDAQMIALDANTGETCGQFGANGAANLKDGLGDVKETYYFPTSMPTVTNGLVIVGGWVRDGRDTNEPSGVIRAYSAENGELAWAWDLGNPGITKLPPEGESYTRGTPNMWSTPAFDAELGLIYLPMGNATPDFWAGHRNEAGNKYGASLVALDIATGRERWHFQFVHQDVWDYDTASQPALYDMADGTPVVVQTTKQGDIYVLDRRDGKPVKKVEERPVEQSHQEGDVIAATQPFSVEMPHLGGGVLTEADMWGATPFDQLACRIAFKKLRYEGRYTPMIKGERTLIYPGFYGGMNWGSMAIDESRGLGIINDIRMPQLAELILREDASPEMSANMSHDAGVHPQEGTPFAALRGGFYSPLGVPCHMPPWGTLSAVDLETGKLVWQRPLGSVEDSVLPNGLKVPLGMQIGMPTLGGPLTTAGGLTFYAGTQDFYLRAIDTATGDEVWKGRMPIGAQATPMTYMGKDGSQYVLIAAGGARQSPQRGDYVVAYRLKK